MCHYTSTGGESRASPRAPSLPREHFFGENLENENENGTAGRRAHNRARPPRAPPTNFRSAPGLAGLGPTFLQDGGVGKRRGE